MSSLIWLALPVLLAIILVSKFVTNGKVPPEETFRCTKCGTRTVHNERTINAWRQGKHKFFCRNCHKNWLSESEFHSPSGRHPVAKTGCLVLFAAPIVLLASMAVLVFFRA